MTGPSLVLVGGVPAEAAARERERARWRRGPLEWRQPSVWKRDWVLSEGGQALATLSARGWLPERFTAEGGGRRWRFPQRWFARYDVCAEGDATPLVRYRPGWLGRGALELGDGTRLVWKRESLWRHSWVIANEEDFVLVRFQATRGWWRTEGEVTLEDAARRRDDLETLVVFGWRLALAAISHARQQHG